MADERANSPTDVVLITGSSGFIGRALAARLKSRYQVVGLDLFPAPEGSGFETIRLDLTKDEAVRKAMTDIAGKYGKRIASVIHLAAYYDLSGEPSPKYEQVTVEGTRRLLRELRRSFTVEQFVFSSTLLVHAPVERGKPMNEDWPLEPKWPYPESKAKTEQLVRQERGQISAVILRLAGVYQEDCRAAFLAQQIARIYEQRPTSYLFAGEPDSGQPYLHLEDLVDALERVVDRRNRLPAEITLLIGEQRGPTYEELQREVGRLVHGRPWPTFSLPRPVAQAGAWVQDEVMQEDPFVKPWMMEIAEDHYELDVGRARKYLGWEPKHDLMATLPTMIARLKDHPPSWYKANKLDASTVAAADVMIERAEEHIEAQEPELVARGEAALKQRHAATRWAHLITVALGAWLIATPFATGLFAGDPNVPAPPAAGTPLPDPSLRDYFLGWSEIASGLLVCILSAKAFARTPSWTQWAVAATGLWIMTAPLVFWTTNAAAYSLDSLVGAMVFAFAVIVATTPGMDRVAIGSDGDLPLGWSYSPSSYVQRVPIVSLAFIGFFISRYLAAYQLGHVPSMWDPFFPGTTPERNGTEAVITSDVSRGFPIPDAGLGALAYMLDILTGIIGDQRRWRTMPWLVLLFGLMIVPLGAVSVGFIIIQPTLIGALCTLCLLQAVVTVILIPYSVDEVLATIQFLIRSTRVGRPFWRTLFRGDAGFSERKDELQRVVLPYSKMAREFISGGVTYPWTLVVSVAIGAYLLTTPLTHGTAPPLYFSDHVVGCLVVTIAVTALAELMRLVRLLNVPLGLWVAVSPFLLEGGTMVGTVADVVLGLALVALSLPRGTRSQEQYGGWNRLIL
ncbi:NAD-dependent epimerase/dehydratase family protein [Dongia deserti]|uniref:NAD-dependent epimerase/dehydratase family protein n=1 Tax=Dongia deserti TaxID=2268030 RepID=UPI000E65465E|nr:NAD-dependent epimerase/dehydratase family protein [Dongia deserti]